MLPKKKRITKNIFQILIKEGRVFSTPLFTFYFKKSNSPQYAFVAPKGNFRKATTRNKFRRKGYNILRNLSVVKGIGIFIYKKQAQKASNEEIKEEISFILNKNQVF